MTITQAKLKWFRDEIKYNYRFPQSYRYLRAFVVTFTGIQKKLTELVSEATFFRFHILKPIPVGRKYKQKQTSKYHSSCALKEARRPLQVLKRAKIISNCDLSPQFFLDNLFEPLKLSWGISCPEENFPYRNRILPQHDLPAPKHVQLHFIFILYQHRDILLIKWTLLAF